MPTFSFTIADAGQATRAMNALCDTEGTNPTQANALKAVKNYVIQTVLTYERSQAMVAAIASVNDPTPITPT